MQKGLLAAESGIKLTNEDMNMQSFMIDRCSTGES